MPEVKLHSDKELIIGSSWLYPLREIEIQFTFSGNSCEAVIVIAVTLCILYQAVLRSQEKMLS